MTAMYYEIGVKNTIVDKKGNDKEVVSKYIVENQVLFGEAEMKGLQLGLANADVVAIKRSALKEIGNNPSGTDSEAIYDATIVDNILQEDGSVKKMKYHVAFYATSVFGANKAVQEYMMQGLEDMECEGIKKTSFIEVIS